MRRGKTTVAVLGVYAVAMLLGPPASPGDAAVALGPVALLVAALVARLRIAWPLSCAFALALVCAMAIAGAGSPGPAGAALGGTALAGFLAAAAWATAPGGAGRRTGKAAPRARAPALALALAGWSLAVGLVLAIGPLLPASERALAASFPGRARLAQALLVAVGAAVAVGVATVYAAPAARAALAFGTERDAARRAVEAEMASPLRLDARVSLLAGLAALAAWWALR